MNLVFDLEPDDERLFADESFEQIERIEHGLLALERGDASAETINEVFRAAHTLKGSAATIGHQRMAELTHAMEDVFDALRGGTIGSVTPFADVLLASVDVLRALVDEVFARELRTDESDALTAELRVRFERARDAFEDAPGGADGGVGSAHDGDDEADEEAAARAGLDALVERLFVEAPAGDDARSVLTATIDTACEWAGVRLLQVVIEAAESGRLVVSAPSQSEIEAGLSDLSIAMLMTGSAAELEGLPDRLRSIDDVDDVSIRTIYERRVDLGPEARGTSPDERVAIAGDRLRIAQQTIRIDVSRLDELLNLVGELVVQKTRLSRQASQMLEVLGADHALAREAEEGAQQFSRVASQLQDQVTGLRMLPIDTVFSRFPRVVRDISSKLNKDVGLIIEGSDTELDRSVLEEVGDPLGHLVRNALDHGIEMPDVRHAAGKPRQGTLTLSASHADGMILIRVQDDGAGIDPKRLRRSAVENGILTEEAAAALSDADALKVIFAPGFSTADTITGLSGRGVGMDVVRTNIERLGGRVEIESTLGRGTRISLSLPLTLAIVGSMLVESSGRVCALPLAGVVETLRIDWSAVSMVRGRPVVVVRDRVVPLDLLDVALGDPVRPLEPNARGFVNIVVVRSRDTELGLAVDAFVGEQEIVLKSMAVFGDRLVGISGGTILADGSVALVIDIGAVVDRRMNRGRIAA